MANHYLRGQLSHPRSLLKLAHSHMFLGSPHS